MRRPQISPTANHTLAAGRHAHADLHALHGARARARRASRYRGLDVYGMGPPSSGGSTVGEALNILEGYDRSARCRATDAMHLRLEASRLAFADRGAYLADRRFFVVPLRGLLSKDFAATRRALIGDQPPRRARSRPATRIRSTAARGARPARRR